MVYFSVQYQTITKHTFPEPHFNPFTHSKKKWIKSAIQHPVVSNFRKPRDFTCFHDFLDTSTNLSNPYIVTCLPRDEPRCCHWWVHRDSSLMVCILNKGERNECLEVASINIFIHASICPTLGGEPVHIFGRHRRVQATVFFLWGEEPGSFYYQNQTKHI